MSQLGLLNLRLAKWELLLSQYNMKFVLHKTIKWVIKDFLANYSVLESNKLYEVIPDKVMVVNTTLKDEI